MVLSQTRRLEYDYSAFRTLEEVQPHFIPGVRSSIRTAWIYVASSFLGVRRAFAKHLSLRWTN